MAAAAIPTWVPKYVRDSLAIVTPVAAATPVNDGEARVLPVKFGNDGIRHRDFRDAQQIFTQSAWDDFPVKGPRTA
eukprot:1953553-Karenia_brevis.AAC.1